MSPRQIFLSRCQHTIPNYPAVVSAVVGIGSQAAEPRKTFQAVILGIPGKYKERLAENIAKTFHVRHLPIPQVVSGQLRKGSHLAKILKLTVKSGVVLPDSYVVKFVKNSIASVDNQSFVMTGFPSTLNQALLFWKEIKLDLVLYPSFPEHVLINLLSEDLDPPKTDVEKHRRLIQARESIRKHSKRIQSMIKFYEKEGVLFACHSNAEEEVWENVKNKMQNKIAVYS